MHPKLLACVALTLAVNSSLGASDSKPTRALLGAEAVLRAAAVAPATEPANQTEAAVQALIVAARKLRVEQASLSPAVAATRWQALWFQMIRIKPDYATGISPQDLSAVMLVALPRPEAWPLIKPPAKTNVQAQPQNPSLLQAVNWSPGISQAKLPEVRQLLSLVLTQNFDEAEALCKGNPPYLQMLQYFRRQVEPSSFEARVNSTLNDTNEYGTRLEIPDILSSLGETKTREIALKLLEKGTDISNIAGQGTAAVFRETALANVATLTLPPWELCCTPEGAALYDALTQRLGNPFKPVSDGSDDYRTQRNNERAAIATIWRAFSWAKNGNQGKATQLLNEVSQALPNDAGLGVDPNNIAQAFGLTPAALYEILSKVDLKQSTSWAVRSLVSVAPAAHKVDELLALLPATAELTALDQLRLAELELSLRLAEGDREKSLAILQNAIAVETTPKATQSEAASEPSSNKATQGDTASNIQFRLAQKACQVGLLLHREDLVVGSVTMLKNLAKINRPADNFDSLSSSLLQTATVLMDHQRLTDAEDLLVIALGRSSVSRNDWYSNDILARLVQLYDKADRPADVLKLINDAPQWSAGDINLLPSQDAFVFCLAKALSKNPQTREKALELALAGLKNHPQEDDGYELLLELQGAQALPLLDQMMQADRWEERPLIWKAELLRRLGRLTEAEAAAKAALAIDPTDGEQASGKRVRGYAVLAAILDAQGRQADAKIYHQVVASVHIAEQGDALKAAGLFKEALAKYEDAAVHFADAYCVQWRLGERLMQAGRTAEAEKHYEAAFSRMPEQFGRMASLCFGCENIFGNPSSRSAADRVLSKMAEKPNALPQALFILARLRIAQDRTAEAYTLLQRAVRQDAEYMDAWKALLGLSKMTDAPPPERQKIVRQLLALDPAGKHTEMPPDDLLILGTASLWQRLQTALDQSSNAKPSYSLPAAARRLETAKGSSSSWMEQENRRKKLFAEFAREDAWNAKGREFVHAFEPLLSPYIGNLYED